MLLNHFNLNHFRVFECVYRTGSMTLAAQELHLTQSGVSQHIRTLEEMLGVTLFDRIKQRLVPTAVSKELHSSCQKGLQEIENGLLQIKDQDKELKGTVTIGMPIEFGNNLIIPLLSQFSRKHPQVKFNLKLGFASAMNQEILNGQMDLAFVDAFRMDKRVTTQKVFDEVLDLCMSEVLAKKHGIPRLQKSFFEKLDYVEYAADEPLLRMWFAHHLGGKESRTIELNVKATVMDVQGLARFIATGAGAGILPSYVVSKLAQEGTSLYRFKGCGKPLLNTISVSYLRDRTHTPAANALLGYLKDALASARGT